MRHLAADLRHAARGLRRAPAFAALAALTLAIGIGATTALYGLVRAALLRPLPYAEPARVVVLWNATAPGETTWLSLRELLGYAAASRTLARVAGVATGAANLTGDVEPERVTRGLVTPDAFATLGTPAQLGRTFTDEQGRPGADAVVVLGDALWRRRFGAAPDVVGRPLRIDGRPHVIVGVMPPGFRLPLEYRDARAPDLWTPLAVDSANPGGWGSRNLVVFARLRAGATPAAATADLRRITDGWLRAGDLAAQDGARFHRDAVPVDRLVTGDVRRPMLLLTGAVALLLGLACANVAALLLARGDGRRRELAVRRALGARRGRLVRQLLAESTLLALGGAVVGAALAWTATRAVVALAPAGVPRLAEARVDAGVLAFATLVALATGLGFGLVPALALSRGDLAATLREGGRGGTAGPAQQRTQRTLATAQVALAVLLVVGSGLFLRSLAALRRVDLGFQPRGVLTARVALPAADYPDAAAQIAFYDALADGAARLPGVRAAAMTRLLPLTGTIGDWSITIEGRPANPRENPNGDWQVVTPGYFEAMGIGLVRGRTLSRADRAGTPPVAVVNRVMAERYWPGGDAVGRRFRLGSDERPWVTIVGVVDVVRHNAVLEAPRAEMYLTPAHFAAQAGSAPRAMTVVLRVAGDPLRVVAPLRATVRALDPNVPVADVQTLGTVVDTALAGPRFTTALLGAFAALALLVAAVGVHGLLALMVAQRAPELGIRLALGAGRGSIAALVLGHGVRVAGAGAALGLVGAAALSRTLGALVYGVRPLDPLTFLAVPALLVVVTVVACTVPAWRAARTDPRRVLR